MKNVWRAVLTALWLVVAALGATGAARAEPAQVTVGTYINKIQDVSFRDNRYVADFYIWFRWKPVGALKDYQPLESFELINGVVASKTSAVEKTIGDMKYASVRVNATIAETWNLENFPFDEHRLRLHFEDSQHVARDLVFVPDTANSRIGDEIDLAGWSVSDFTAETGPKVYKTNYGDSSLPTDARSEYSRFTVSMSMTRDSYGSAYKLLSTVLAATAVAFVAFMVKPTDLDPRFGLGVGALFAVAASAFVVSSSVPDSGVMTVADFIHIIAMASIFASLLQSALALKFEVTGREKLADSLDHWSLVIFPVIFFGWSFWVIAQAIR